MCLLGPAVVECAGLSQIIKIIIEVVSRAATRRQDKEEMTRKGPIRKASRKREREAVMSGIEKEKE